MNLAVKWIGGATLAVGIVFASALLTNYALDATTAAEPKLTAEEVLDFDGERLAGDSAPETGAPQAPATGEAGEEPEAASGEGADAAGPAQSAAKPSEAFVIKRILPIEGPIKYGEWHWDDEGVPAGPLVMTVDLEARVISVFRGGYEIGAAAVLLGTDEYPTPLGKFPILTKERHNVSEKYNNAPMPWTLRLTWDGVAIHGGSTVENGYASHGCIAAPDPFVSRLYDIAKKGDLVIITRGVTTGVGKPLLEG